MNEQNNSAMTGTGYLIVRVSTALGAIPVAGASVIVRDYNGLSENNGAVIANLTTNEDGITPKIVLSAPPLTNSTVPGNNFPYASYNIDVYAEGYYRQFFTGVPVYDGITSIQPAMLVPLAQSQGPDNIEGNGSYFEEGVNPSLKPDQQNS